MILKLSDFEIGEYLIPNATDNSIMSDRLGNKNTTQWIIDKYEVSMLIKLLGFELYNLLKAEIDLTETNRLKPTADIRFKELLNGKDNYNGLVDAIVPYVFYQFIRINESHNTSIGIHKSQSKSGENFGPRTKAVDAYNEFVIKTVGLNNKTNVTEWSGYYSIIHNSNSNLFKSVYDFINDNKNVYPEWIKFNFMDNDFTGINSFDL